MREAAISLEMRFQKKEVLETLCESGYDGGLLAVRYAAFGENAGNVVVVKNGRSLRHRIPCRQEGETESEYQQRMHVCRAQIDNEVESALRAVEKFLEDKGVPHAKGFDFGNPCLLIPVAS